MTGKLLWKLVMMNNNSESRRTTMMNTTLHMVAITPLDPKLDAKNEDSDVGFRVPKKTKNNPIPLH